MQGEGSSEGSVLQQSRDAHLIFLLPIVSLLKYVPYLRRRGKRKRERGREEEVVGEKEEEEGDEEREEGRRRK